MVYQPLLQSRLRRGNSYSLSRNSEQFAEPDCNLAAVTPLINPLEGDLFQLLHSTSHLLADEVPVAIDNVIDSPSLETILDRVVPFLLRLIGYTSIPTVGTLEAIAAYIQDSSLLSCSDGSHDPERGKGGHGWLISDSQGHILWSGAGPIDGIQTILLLIVRNRAAFSPSLQL